MQLCTFPLVVALLAGVSAGCAVSDGAEDREVSEIDIAPPPATAFVLSVSALEGPFTVTSATGSNTCDFFHCDFAFIAGTAVTIHALQANIADCLAFTSWTGACAGQGLTCQLVMNSDLSTSARYGRIAGCRPQ
jgi:hypothetical protein